MVYSYFYSAERNNLTRKKFERLINILLMNAPTDISVVFFCVAKNGCNWKLYSTITNFNSGLKKSIFFSITLRKQKKAISNIRYVAHLKQSRVTKNREIWHHRILKETKHITTDHKTKELTLPSICFQKSVTSTRRSTICVNIDKILINTLFKRICGFIDCLDEYWLKKPIKWVEVTKYIVELSSKHKVVILGPETIYIWTFRISLYLKRKCKFNYCKKDLGTGNKLFR